MTLGEGPVVDEDSHQFVCRRKRKARRMGDERHDGEGGGHEGPVDAVQRPQIQEAAEDRRLDETPSEANVATPASVVRPVAAASGQP